METDKPWSAKRHLFAGFVTLVFLVFGFGSWSTFAQISGAIVAQGRFETDHRHQIVQHQSGGTVAEILVDEGDSVTAGDLLVKLDDMQLASQLTIVETQLFEMIARRARLQAEQDEANIIRFDDELLSAGVLDPNIYEITKGQTNLFFARRESVRQEIEQLSKRKEQIEEEIIGLSSQEQSVIKQLDLNEEELVNQKSLLSRQLIPVGPVLQLEREAARLQGQLGELASSKSQAEGRITEISIEQLTLATRNRENSIVELRDLRSRELELIERRSALRHEIDQLAIRAPSSGIVYDMKFRTPRSVVRPAETLMHLVPQDRPLVIAARVDLAHIDELVLGQEVTLRLSTLDQRSSPELYGEVVRISADTFEDNVTGQNYYRVEIALKLGELEKLPDPSVLVSGMPVETYIKTSERSPIIYLIKPLTDYFSRAFRET